MVPKIKLSQAYTAAAAGEEPREREREP